MNKLAVSFFYLQKRKEKSRTSVLFPSSLETRFLTSPSLPTCNYRSSQLANEGRQNTIDALRESSETIVHLQRSAWRGRRPRLAKGNKRDLPSLVWSVSKLLPIYAGQSFPTCYKTPKWFTTRGQSEWPPWPRPSDEINLKWRRRVCEDLTPAPRLPLDVGPASSMGYLTLKPEHIQFCGDIKLNRYRTPWVLQPRTLRKCDMK